MQYSFAGDIFRYLTVHAVELVGDVAGDHGGHDGGQVGLLDEQVLDGGAVPEDVPTLAGRDDAHLRTRGDHQQGRDAGGQQSVSTRIERKDTV